MQNPGKSLEELKLQLQSALMLMEYLYDLKSNEPNAKARFQALHQSFYEDAKRELEDAKRHAGT
jgi:hypothetical protein